MEEYRLKIENMSKSFPGVKALDNIKLAVKPGSVHALIGENGAGKSTLMKCLFGLYHPDSGTIEIDGRVMDIKEKRHFHDSPGAESGSLPECGGQYMGGQVPDKGYCGG